MWVVLVLVRPLPWVLMPGVVLVSGTNQVADDLLKLCAHPRVVSVCFSSVPWTDIVFGMVHLVGAGTSVCIGAGATAFCVLMPGGVVLDKASASSCVGVWCDTVT